MREARGRTWVRALVAGAVAFLLTAAPAGADDKVLEELKARLDRLEKQNQELKEKLDAVSNPYTATSVPAAAPASSGGGTNKLEINTLIDSYLKDKEARQQ